MKKFFILILLIGILGTAHYFYRKITDSNNIEPPITTGGKTFHPDSDSATFTFDEETITLSQGKNDDQNFETILLDEKAYGDLNDDNKEDSVVLLSQSGGGSGVFIYAAAYVSGPVNYKGSNAVFLGDRISPQSIYINSGVATVNYLDRKPDEALASEPTIPVSKQFVYKNGEFQER